MTCLRDRAGRDSRDANHGPPAGLKHASQRRGFGLEVAQASAIPAPSPARWLSQETEADVGRIPLSMPPYPKRQAADKTRVPNVRRKYASEAR